MRGVKESQERPRTLAIRMLTIGIDVNLTSQSKVAAYQEAKRRAVRQRSMLFADNVEAEDLLNPASLIEYALGRIMFEED